jgi:uncharacterized protein YbcI
VVENLKVFGHAGFFSPGGTSGATKVSHMNESGSTQAQQVARTLIAFEREQTGRRPKSVAVVLGGETLVAILHGALSPAEQSLAQTPAGLALLQEFHRALLANACSPLWQEVGRITGTEVRAAGAEVQGATGTVVLIFLLAGSAPIVTWSGTAPGD